MEVTRVFKTSLIKSVGRHNTIPRSTRFFSTANGNVLVVADHDNTKVSSSVLNTITAAKQLGKNITVLVAGDFKGNQTIPKQIAKIDGVSKVIVADNEKFAHPVAESVTSLVTNVQKQLQSNYVLAPSNTFGKNFIPRVAALLNVQAISDITAIKSPDTFVRPIYAGNALATVQSSDPIKIMTVRGTAFEKASEQSSEAEISSVTSDNDSSAKVDWVKDEVKASARPDLTAARVVVSGGRALKSAENFKILEELADQLGAAVGASRAAVDAGYAANDLQVGQTGKIVAPELYIAVGISGAIQHLAGMKDSKAIVAINTDAEAPIFQVADYGLVGDLFSVVPELTQSLKSAKQ